MDKGHSDISLAGPLIGQHFKWGVIINSCVQHRKQPLYELGTIEQLSWYVYVYWNTAH